MHGIHKDARSAKLFLSTDDTARLGYYSEDAQRSARDAILYRENSILDAEFFETLWFSRSLVASTTSLRSALLVTSTRQSPKSSRIHIFSYRSKNYRRTIASVVIGHHWRTRVYFIPGRWPRSSFAADGADWRGGRDHRQIMVPTLRRGRVTVCKCPCHESSNFTAGLSSHDPVFCAPVPSQPRRIGVGARSVH